jgi:hypothetical protein
MAGEGAVQMEPRVRRGRLIGFGGSEQALGRRRPWGVVRGVVFQIQILQSFYGVSASRIESCRSGVKNINPGCYSIKKSAVLQSSGIRDQEVQTGMGEGKK